MFFTVRISFLFRKEIRIFFFFTLKKTLRGNIFNKKKFTIYKS